MDGMAGSRIRVGLHAALRDGTRAEHAALDAAAAGLDLAQRGDMAAFLSMMAAGVAPVEQAIARGRPPAPDWPRRRRMPALRADLATLRRGAPPPIAVAIPQGPCAALGALYVLEGARVGGRMLARRAAQSADPAVRDATRFLNDPRGPGLWRDFVAGLNALPPGAVDRDAAVGGARAAFDVFLRAAALWLPARAGDGSGIEGAA
jgi:heme oxygenase